MPRPLTTRSAIALFALSLMAASPASAALAQAAPPATANAPQAAEDADANRPQININVTGARVTGQEARDLQVINRALEAMQRNGYPGLTRHLGALRAVLDRAPAAYPLVEVNGNRWIVRADDMSDVLLVAAAASASAQKGGATGAPTQIDVVRQDNVYGLASLLLGSDAVERRAYDDAITYLDKGLAIQPDNVMLAFEKGAALQGLQKWQEAIDVSDAMLARKDLLIITHTAPLHRRRGASLIELGRLDEAQAAFDASLKSEPGNNAALNELAYITQLRAGRPATPIQLIPNRPSGAELH